MEHPLQTSLFDPLVERPSLRPLTSADIGPVRTRAVSVTEEQLQAANETEGRTGDSVWLRGEEEIELIKAVPWADRGDVPEEKVLRWASHPDERVRMALLESHLMNRPDVRETGQAVWDATEPYMGDGEYWNPVLDRLASAEFGAWPYSGEVVVGQSGHTTTHSYPPGEGAHAWFHRHVSSWLSSQAEGISLKDAQALLDNLEYHAIRTAVIERVVVTREALEWVRASHPNLLTHLTRNDHIEEDGAAALWSTVLEYFQKGTSMDAERIVRDLGFMGLLPDSAMDELMAIAEAKADEKYGVDWTLTGALWALRSKQPESMDIQKLRRLYALVRRSKDKVMIILGSPETDDALREHIAQDTDFPKIREHIGAQYGHLPGVRKVFEKSTSKKLILKMSKHADGEELVSLLLRLAKKDPTQALRELVRRQNHLSTPSFRQAGAESEKAIDDALFQKAYLEIFELLAEKAPYRAFQERANLKRIVPETDEVFWFRKLVREACRKNPGPVKSMVMFDKMSAHLEREDWLPLLAHEGEGIGEKVKGALEHIESAWKKDPEARKIILEDANHSVFVKLLDSARPEEYRMLALRIVNDFRWSVQEMYEKYPHLFRVLTPEDVSHLLESSSREVRQTAIVLMGELRGEEPEPPAEPEEPDAVQKGRSR